MKIYVDGEMPSYIEQKIIHTNDGKLCEIGLCFNSTDIDENEENYIKQTAELEAEVRKQVVEEIKVVLASCKKSIYNPDGDVIGTYLGFSHNEILNILDQVERREKDVKD